MKEEERTDLAEQSENTESTEAPVNPRRFIGVFLEYLEMFVWSFFAVIVIFTFAFRLCRVEGESMHPTLEENQPLLLYSLNYTPKQGDIIVFQREDYKDGERLIKRVIATGGQTIRIDTAANEITVDGIIYDDCHASLKNPDGSYNSYLFAHDFQNGVMELTVPEGYLFVMGDNRNNSLDSRSNAIGLVDERTVLGKAIFRISPFALF